MRVSVVLPTYDRGPVLGGAIDSVLNQTHEDLELVVVDGGSTDGTPEVVRSFSDPRLRYIRNDEPAGVSAARNAGIRAGDGELVAFIDSDDRWREDKLRKQVTEMERAGPSCGVVYAGITKSFGQPLARDGESGDVHEAARTLSIPTYTSILAVKREALDRCGGFDERLRCFEDWELCLRLAREYAFRYVDQPLVVKGTSGDNVSADPERLAEAIRLLRREYDLPDETLAQLYADAGLTYFEAGRLREGRPYVRRSLRLDPAQFDAAVGLLLSLSRSSAVFDAVIQRVYAAERLASRLTER